MKFFILRPIMFSVCVLFTSVFAHDAEVIVNPVEHYVDWVYGGEHDIFMEIVLGSGSPITLLKLEADIDDDGQSEVLLSLSGLVNAQDGNIWDVYTPVPGGYRVMGGLIFHLKAFYVGDFKEYGRGIVKYVHSSSASGMLVHTRIEKGRSVETSIREIFPKDNHKDMALYNSLFGAEQRPVVEEIPLFRIVEQDSMDNQDTETKAISKLIAPQDIEALSSTEVDVPQMPATAKLPSGTPQADEQTRLSSGKNVIAGNTSSTISWSSWILMSTLYLFVLLASGATIVLLWRKFRRHFWHDYVPKG